MVKHWLMLETSPDAVRSPYRARLASVGRRLPSTHLTTEDLMASTRHRTHIDLERLTGIHERRVSIGEDDSYTLAIAAALDGALADPVVEHNDVRPVQRLRRDAVGRHGAQQLDPPGHRRARHGRQRRVHLAARPERSASRPQRLEPRAGFADP